MKKQSRCGVVLALVASTAGAAGFEPRAATSLGFSDNVDRAADTQQSETVLGAEAGFVWQHTRSRLQADVDAAILRREYLEGVFDGETLGRARAEVDYAVVPEMLAWSLDENFGQIASEPFGAIRPADREDANYLTTGPDLRLQFGAADTLNVLMRASDVYYSESDTDNTRYGAQAQWLHVMTPRRAVSFNVFSGRTHFDRDDLYLSYNLHQVFLRLDTEARRTTIGAELGANRVSDRLDSETGGFAKLTVYRLISPATIVGLDYSRGFSDSADAFRIDQSSVDTSQLDQRRRVAADPFDEDRLSLSYLTTGARTFAHVALYGTRERYQRSVELNRDIRGINARLAYKFTSVLEGALYGLNEKIDEPGLTNEFTDREAGAELRLRLSATLNAELHVERYERHVDRGALPDFAENRAFIALTYAPPLAPRPATLFPAREVAVPTVEGSRRRVRE